MEEKESLEEILSTPVGEFLEEQETPDDKTALEECLYSIATIALEQKAGKRQAITCAEIQSVFAAHDVQEIFEEAELFFGDKDDEGEDLSKEPGEESEYSEDELDSEEE